MRYHYYAFGLNFSSELAINYLNPTSDFEAPDVSITLGETPASLDTPYISGQTFQATEQSFLLSIADVARFWVLDGKRVIVDPAKNSSPAQIQIFLLGSVIGALFYQRHQLVLHGSATISQGLGVAFIGRSGAGKSTIATILGLRGYPILTDDLCVMQTTGQETWIQPGIPHSKLWPDSLSQLQLSSEDLPQVHHKRNKRLLPTTDNFADKPTPLRKLYVIRPRPIKTPSLQPIIGLEKVQVLRNHVYRTRYLASDTQKSSILNQVLFLAEKIPMVAIIRPTESFHLQEYADLVEADILG